MVTLTIILISIKIIYLTLKIVVSVRYLLWGK